MRVSSARTSGHRRPGWAVLDLPLPVRSYVLALPVIAVAVLVWTFSTSPLVLSDVVLGVLLLGAGALSVEASGRMGEPAGTVVKDLLSAWWLPLAVLLPPQYALLAPFPLMLITQYRVRPTLVHRRVFSAAATGLSYAAVSFAFHAAFPGREALPYEGPLADWLLAVAAAGLVAAAANALLIAAAVKAVDAQTRWRELLWDAEDLRVEGVELCVGITVSVMAGVSPLLVAVTLPPVLLLQRGMLHGQLRAAALLDAKTGLLNAVTWEREAAGKLLSLHRRRQSVTVLLIDIDHFKQVNDRFGHLAGDDVLRAVAATLASGLRDGDLLGRFGGEEFVALLPATDSVETAVVAERLRQQVADLVVRLEDGTPVGATVSIGVASSPDSTLTVPDLLAAADLCMYRAKAGGRNQVVDA